VENLDRDSILSILKQNKKSFHDIYGVIKLGLFGSFADGSQGVNSDIDIIVDFKKEMKNIHNFLKVKRHLEKEFGRNVDLGIENAIKPAIKRMVIEKTIYV